MVKYHEALDVYPSGISAYSPSGRISFITAANDTTQADFRPREPTLPDRPGDSKDRWSLVAQHSLNVGGTYRFSNVTCDGGPANVGPAGKGKGKGNESKDRRLPERRGRSERRAVRHVDGKLVNTFEVAEDCSKHVLATDFGGTPQTVWPYRPPGAGVFA
ncbi:hypothetical protein ColKHC_01022 [Colletotrichum higginsianum]|nr:hypothetical protein ColKHC_01022 [Colletotrichum higginsianum]